MNARARVVLAAAFAAVAASGCAAYPGTARPASIDDLRGEQGWMLLDTVPLVRQVSDKGCGAACLAMVLAHWGFEERADVLEDECADPGTEGIRADFLRDAAKRRGLSAFLFKGTLKDIEHELARGRPVVVGLAKPKGEGFTAHFEVVVGLDAAGGRIAALDPAIGLTCDSLAGFEAEWRLTKGVTLVMFLPETRTVVAGVDTVDYGGGR